MGRVSLFTFRSQWWRSHVFSATAIIALLSTLLPWSAGLHQAPLFVMIDWLRGSSVGDVALGAGVLTALLVVLLAVLVDLRGELLGRRAQFRVVFVVGVGVLATNSLGIFAFSDQLPERTHFADAIVFFPLLRPIEFWSDPLRGVVRAVLVFPAVLAAAIGTRSALAARHATRVIAAHTVAGALLVWSPLGAGIGYWTSVTAAALMLVSVAAFEWSSRWRYVWTTSLFAYAALLVAVSLPARAELRRRLARMDVDGLPEKTERHHSSA